MSPKQKEKKRSPASAGDSAPVRPDKPRGPLDVLWYVAIIPVILSFGYTVIRGSDLWWHIATGRLIVGERSIPSVDQWSFTAVGRPWLQHEWLSDVTLYLWSSVAGVSSLVYWKWAILLLTFGLLFHTVARLTGDRLTAFAAMLLAVAVAAPFIDIRPHLYSYLLFVLVLHLVAGRDRPPYYLPVIFLIWVNLHGGFILGLLAITLLFLPYLFTDDRGGQKRAAIVWAVSVAACLVNPNGTGAFTYPLKYAFDQTSMYSKVITEWAPPFSPGGIQSPLFPYSIAAFAVAAAFLLYKRDSRRQSSTLPLIGLGALTLAMALTSRRFIFAFGISQALITGQALAMALRTYTRRLPWFIGPAAAAVLGIVWMLPLPLAPYAFHYIAAEDEFPIEVCSFIDANNLSGNVFAYYNWGGYLHYRTGGRMKVYIDGRADTVFDNSTLQQYSQVQQFRSGWESIVDQSAAQYVLWPRNEDQKAMSSLITSGKWRVLYDDFVSYLLIRSDAPDPSPLVQTPDSAYRRLSAGVRAMEQRKLDQAATEFTSALELMPYLKTACVDLAQVQTAAGSRDAARETLNRCLKYFPDRAELERLKQLDGGG